MFDHAGMLVSGDGVGEQLSRMTALYDDGQLLKAFELGKTWGSPKLWPTNDAMILAGRILANLGAPRLARQLHLRAFRAAPADSQAIYYAGFAVLERRGPLAAIDYWEQHQVTDPYRADWLAMRGTLATIFRDFDTADRYISEAEQLGGDKPWICVERARLLETQDRFEDALAMAKQSMEMRPWFRPGVHAVAHLLQVLDRDDQALELLIEAGQRIESALIQYQLATLQDQLDLHADALKTLEKVDALCPIPERQFGESLAWIRSNVVYHAGDHRAAAEFAEQAKKNEFMQRMARQLREAISENKPHKRVLLDLPFVRQHYMTCAPATLAALGRFFGKPTDHLSVVDAICYDGTASYSQRKWANNSGWATREFTLSWDSAVALIDRNIPFALATVQVTSGHMQAVIGYDVLRGTLLCRDPYQYYITEFHSRMMLESQAASGPRAMVLVPADKAHLLDGLDLPDAGLYDHLYELERSLAEHNRLTAVIAADKLTAEAPGHRLTFHAQRALAAYDGNQTAALAAIESLLALYPKSPFLLFSKALHLRSLERPDLLLPFLSACCESSRTDPSFFQLQAEMVQQTTGDRTAAEKLLRKALRRQPTQAQCLLSLGHQYWSQRKLEKAAQLYQMAAAVDSLKEAAVQTYFNASRYLNKTEEALALLKKRSDRNLPRSSQPAQTYFWALDVLDRTPEAFAVLDDAQTKRPSDGNLLLFAADAFGRRNNLARARQLLEDAKGKCHQAFWLRTAARLSFYEGNLLEALVQWKQVLDSEPLAGDANNEVARLIAQTEGTDAATRHLDAVLERFPYSTEIQQIRIVQLRAVGRSAVSIAAKRLVDQQPGNIWAQVELALSLTELGQLDTALSHVRSAIAASPHAMNAHYAHALVLERMLKVDEARQACREAIAISIDFGPAMQKLLALCPTPEQKKSEMDFIHQELQRQVTFGDALLNYRSQASSVLDAQIVLDTLQQAKERRGDLWQAYSALLYHLGSINRLDDALKIAQQATERFPLVPRVWYDLSYLHGLQGDRPGKIAALQQCLEMSPAWSFAARQLAETLRLEGDEPAGMAVLERAIHRDPLDGENHHALAEMLWNNKQADKAIEHAMRAVKLDPSLNDAWSSLSDWLNKQNKSSELTALAREICRQRAGEAMSWLLLARVLTGADTFDERLCACESALKLSPLDVEAHDLKVCLLMEQKRFSDAKEACTPAVFNGNIPVPLRGRHAWILSQQNDLVGAVDEMRLLLDIDPRYYWGWRQLVTWLNKLKSPAEYLTAAKEMCRLFPHDAVARNHLASALQKTKGDAKQTLLDAVKVTPDNAYALQQLFGTQIKDKEFTSAEATLKLIQRHFPVPEFLRRKIELAAAQGDAVTANQTLSTLCTGDNFEIGALTDAVRAMDNARMQKQVNAALNQAGTADKAVSAELVQFWTARAAASSQWSACQDIIKLFEVKSPQWTAATVAFLDGLVTKKAFARVNRLIRKLPKGPDRPTLLWGKVGYAVFAQGNSRKTITQLSDWATRADAQPWMLLNLIHAFRRTNQWPAACEVGKFAVSLPDDHTTLKHRIWLALDEMVAGKTGENYNAVLRADTAKIDRHYPYLMNIIRALAPMADVIVTSDTGATARRAVSKSAARVANWSTQRELRLAQRRAARRVLTCHPSLVNRIWYASWWLRTAITLSSSTSKKRN